MRFRALYFEREQAKDYTDRLDSLNNPLLQINNLAPPIEATNNRRSTEYKLI